MLVNSYIDILENLFEAALPAEQPKASAGTTGHNDDIKPCFS